VGVLTNGEGGLEAQKSPKEKEAVMSDRNDVSGGDNGRDDEPSPEIKPPVPNEIPSPQATQPEIEPYQAPPPADPGMPQPEA
jgi:hypothetical protein